MHENLKYLETGATLLKDLVVGRDSPGENPGTLYKALRAHWTEPAECSIEVAAGKPRTIPNVSSTTCWDLAYKQLWIFVLRNFADLGARAPRKETGDDGYEAKMDPNCHHRLVELAWNLGFHTEKIKTGMGNDPRREQLRAFLGRICKLQPDTLEKTVDSMLRLLPPDEEIEPLSDFGERGLSKTEIDDLGRRWGVPFTRMYKRGQASFYLPELLVKTTGNSDEMPSVSFIHKDFIDAFFGPTIDFRERLRDSLDENNCRPDLDNASGDRSPSEDNSSLLEETLNVEQSCSVMGTPQPSPTPALFAMTDATAADINTVGSEELSTFGIKNDSPSVLSSVVGSPELSPVASISLVSFIERIPTPPRPSDKQDKPLVEPTMTIVVPSTEMNFDRGIANMSSAEPQVLGLVARAPRWRESLLTLDLPQERPLSPVMSLLQSPPHYLLEYKPAFNGAIAQPADTIELSAYFPLSLPTAKVVDNRRLDFREQVAYKSSLQLPSKP